MKSLYLFFVVMSLGLSACSIMQRSESSGYANESGPSYVQDYYREKRANSFSKAREDLGYNTNSSYELSENEANAVRQRVELQRLEKDLSYEAEQKQYYSYKPYFRNDAERIYFLKIPGRDARERWARAKGISTDETKFDTTTSHLIENNDISKGMSKAAVQQSWGEPEFVEIAGNPLYGNERWRYNKLMSTEEGYKQEARIVYFEAGRVVGWETQ